MGSEAQKITELQLWIAIVGLIGTLIVSLINLIQQWRLKRNLDDIESKLQASLRRPLEGEWNYKIDYTKFHGNSIDKFEANGKAIFIWKTNDHFYQTYIMMGVEKEGAPQELLVVVVAIGKLKANESGWPSEKNMSIEYYRRLGKHPFEASTFTTTQYTNIRCSKSTDGKRAEKIEAWFDSGQSSGPVVFTR